MQFFRIWSSYKIWSSNSIWTIQDSDPARYGLQKIWIAKDLDPARFGLHKIWSMQDLDRTRFLLCKFWIKQDLYWNFKSKLLVVQNIDCAKFGSCNIIWIMGIVQSLDFAIYRSCKISSSCGFWWEYLFKLWTSLLPFVRPTLLEVCAMLPK